MRKKIPGKNLNLLVTNSLLEDLDKAQLKLGKERSSIIRSAIEHYMITLNISEKFDESELNKESDEHVFKNRNNKETE